MCTDTLEKDTIFILVTEAVCSCETLVLMYQTIQFYNPEDHNDLSTCVSEMLITLVRCLFKKKVMFLDLITTACVCVCVCVIPFHTLRLHIQIYGQYFLLPDGAVHIG